MSRVLINNKTSDLTGIHDIINLAKLLKNNGDKVLSASSKLSLSTKLLNNLNEAFSLIISETDDLESSFQVCNSSRNEIFRDIKFLHDFVQKTIGLKIQHNPNDMKVNDIDITKFRHLKYLELQKIPVEIVKGIQAIRGQLECIICTGGSGVNCIEELLASCGGDAGVGFIWGSLSRLSLPYNGLKHLDKSLEYAPWMETIDLSHNLFKKITELEYLPNLRNVNLSYNNLESVPQFNKASYHALQKLILKNNFIDNINGLQGLECLIELDLSYNCLMHHSVLWPLETMSMLMWLCLEGNPLYYHSHHRLHTIKHLHSSLNDNKFILDRQPLSKSEKLLISENQLFTITTLMYRPYERVPVLSTSNFESVTSLQNDSCMETNEKNSEILSRDDLKNCSKKQMAKKKKDVREAIITEDDLEKEHIKSNSNSFSNTYLESSIDYLETKKQILALRAQYGEDNWLSSHPATYIQNIMGLKNSAAASSTILSSTFTDNHESFQHTTFSATSMSPILPASMNLLYSVNDTHECSKDALQKNSENLENKMKIKQLLTPELENTNEKIRFKEEPQNEMDDNIPLKFKFQEKLDVSYDPEEEKGDLYLVQKKKGQEEPDEIFLIISSEDIKERDSINGKIRFRWAADTVLSCILGRGMPTTVDITFDTTRKDREARTYIADFEDAKKIVQTLNEMIKRQPVILKIFKCMKCSTHFSQDDDNNIVISLPNSAQLKCPTCKSTLVIQTDELPTSAPSSLEKVLEKTKLESQKGNSNEFQLPHSNSQSSIGGTDGGAISITTSQVHFNYHSQAQIYCSATSLEESRESTPSAGTSKKYESDIEVLSNPSQSSIEVLEDRSKLTTTYRKISKEGQAASLLSISDTTLFMGGLTESSSSGSFTDSVCTTYENKTHKLLDKTEMSNSRNTSDVETIKVDVLNSESAFAPVISLTSMLGDLLQSMKIGSSKETMLKSEENPEFTESNIQYSYTNFNNVDHRIKLHIILNVFEHENEDLAFLLRADILIDSSIDTFPGCLIVSTAKVYILKINGLEGEDPQRWLCKESSWTIDRLRSFAPLPFKQGVLLELEQPTKLGNNFTNNVVLCILQDFQRTSNFLFYLTNSPVPASCEVEFTVPEYCNNSMKNILKFSKINKQDDSIKYLALFSSAILKLPNDIIKLKVSTLIVTSSTLIVMQDQIHWLLSENNKAPTIVTEQRITNLIEIDFSGNSLVLNFLDEVVGGDASWTLNFLSSNAAEAVINSIRPPWEELFSIPLQINVHVSEKSIKNCEKT